MFYNADSGLYLTQYRAYDPVAGRWLSRDPAGETIDSAANPYTYVNANPVTGVDPWGLAKIPAPTDSNGNPLPPPTPLPPGKNGENNSWVPCAPSGTGDRDTKWKPKFSVSSETGAQPGASWDPDYGHWDIDDGEGRTRVDPEGNPANHNFSGNPSAVLINPPPWWIIIPFIPFPGNPVYGGF
jgi:RHS repeat-associated protein